MPHARASRSAALIAGLLLIATLLFCAGTTWMVRRGQVRPFVAELPVWPGVALTVRNGPLGVCHPGAACPRQIGLQPGLSIWLTRRAGAGESGTRLVFVPSAE
jgi:hypothetical protein